MNEIKKKLLESIILATSISIGSQEVLAKGQWYAQHNNLTPNRGDYSSSYISNMTSMMPMMPIADGIMILESSSSYSDWKKEAIQGEYNWNLKGEIKYCIDKCDKSLNEYIKIKKLNITPIGMTMSSDGRSMMIYYKKNPTKKNKKVK